MRTASTHHLLHDISTSPSASIFWTVFSLRSSIIVHGMCADLDNPVCLADWARSIGLTFMAAENDLKVYERPIMLGMLEEGSDRG